MCLDYIFAFCGKSGRKNPRVVIALMNYEIFEILHKSLLSSPYQALAATDSYRFFVEDTMLLLYRSVCLCVRLCIVFAGVWDQIK